MFGRTKARDRGRGHGGAQWTPAMLGSKRVRDFDAESSHVTKDGSDLISAIANSVPGATDTLAQATGAYQPTWVDAAQNGRPVIRFAGGHMLATSTALAVTTFTIVAVWKQSVGGMLYEHSVNVNANNGHYLYGPGGNTIIVNRGGTVSAYTRATLADSTWRVTTHDYGGANATHGLRLNGVAASLTNGTTGDPGAASTSQTLYVGGRSGAPPLVPMTGDLARLILCTPQLTAAEITMLERYCGRLYGIAVA
jgi:hypothetical protein